MKRNTHKLNVKLLAIMQTVYGVARVDALGSAARPITWGKQQKGRANEFSTRVLAEVVFPAIRPYEKALAKYAVFDLSSCATWQDGECSCGLDEMKRTIRANQLLAESQ